MRRQSGIPRSAIGINGILRIATAFSDLHHWRASPHLPQNSAVDLGVVELHFVLRMVLFELTTGLEVVPNLLLGQSLRGLGDGDRGRECDGECGEGYFHRRSLGSISRARKSEMLTE